MPIDIQMPVFRPTFLTSRSYLRMQVSIDAGTEDTNSPAIDPCMRRGERIFRIDMGA